MSERENRLVSEFSESLHQLSDNTNQLGTMLSRTLQALSQHGVQLSVDLDGLVRGVQQDLTVVQRRSTRVTQQINQLQELVDTVALITSSLELDQVLAEVMDTVIQMTGAERAYLMLKNEDSDKLSIRAARNWDRETLSDEEVVFSGSVINAALNDLEPIVTTNAQGDTRFQEMKSVVQHGLRSILCIPLAMQGRAVGVLYADNRIDKGIFSQDDVPLLTAFGIQAAIAIENARTFEAVKDDLAEAQRAIKHLQIQIDQQKLQQDVSEITGSDYFDRISQAAREIRQNRQARRSSGTDRHE
ncbi:MAG: GAF domain-containing protein [Chloroflexi bacterium]|nr:GAF domain-containing protein [Chloroflexota bacterium]